MRDSDGMRHCKNVPNQTIGNEKYTAAEILLMDAVAAEVKEIFADFEVTSNELALVA